MNLTRGITVGVLLGASAVANAETIRIAIGHQSKCTDTYSGGVLIKELGLLEKRLPKDGKYKDAKFEIDWKDYESGAPITNQMLANKIDIGVMGDFPLIVNGAKFQETKSLETLYVSGTGYNKHGSGNAVVVPINSDIYSFEQLKGKAISTPVGSAAWGMTLKAIQDLGLSQAGIEIRNQSPPVGAANIAEGKIDAHADFCPWSEIIEYRGTGRKIYDGSEAGVPYLHGVVVRKDYAEQYPEIVLAFVKAIVDAGDWVHQDPVRAATSLEKWTGVEKEVQYLYFSRGGTLTLEPTIKPQWVETLKQDHKVLVREKAIPPLDFDRWITDRYIRQAYKELGRDYDKDLKYIADPKVENKKLPPGEVWHAKKGLVSYPSVTALLKAAEGFKKTGDLRATYVYDQTTGLKIFGHVAFYVKTKDATVPFMRKTDAERFSKSAGGKLVAFDDALKLAATETTSTTTAAR
jgi:NitT/TauT family transport system substrate-binding protein